MKRIDWKELGLDILVDIAAGLLIAIGVYNFALNADFPVAGFSGIAIIMYHLLNIPVGVGTVILNIPVAIFCYKFLGRTFFLKSLKSIICVFCKRMYHLCFSGNNFMLSRRRKKSRRKK